MGGGVGGDGADVSEGVGTGEVCCLEVGGIGVDNGRSSSVSTSRLVGTRVNINSRNEIQLDRRVTRARPGHTALEATFV